MRISILCLLLVIFGIMLLLYAAVALIQDKRIFSSAPKDAYEKIQDHPERFKGQHVLGWILAAAAIVMILSGIVFSIYDGIQKQFGCWQLFARFLVISDGYKIWDMLFLDRWLLTRSGFFEHYYPEVAGTEGMQKAGFNNKSQFLKLLVIFPLVSAAAALLISLLF